MLDGLLHPESGPVLRLKDDFGRLLGMEFPGESDFDFEELSPHLVKLAGRDLRGSRGRLGLLSR
jgi:hypothetical protein